MAVLFPSALVPNGQKISYLSAGKVVRGVTQAAQRAVYSSHLHQIEATYPLKSGTDIAELKAFIADAEFDEVLYPVRQPELGVIPAMSATLSAAVSGSTLPLQGLDAAYAISKGQFLSVIDGGNGRRYLYQLKTASPAGATSRNVTIIGTVRKAHASGSVVEITQPYLQGDLDGRELSLDVAIMAGVGFTISELR